MTTKTETGIYYIVESSGDNRQIWGPYATLSAAKHAAGVRHSVITGSGLTHGQIMRRGEVQAAIQSGRIHAADGSDPSALA